MGRRILNRRDLRAEYDAAERREQDTDTEQEEEDEEEEEGGEGAEAEGEAEEGEGGEEEEEEAPVKKKKKAPAKEPKPKRERKTKNVRMRVVWKVFNNSNQAVATYDYPKKQEAEDHAAKLKADKGQTFFVQPVKEEIK
jgi:hypothetical protein